MEIPPIQTELIGEGKTAKFNYEGNIVFGAELRNQALNTRHRASFESSSVRAERSFPLNVPRRVQVLNGLSIRVNFNKETALVRTKIETLINYVHMNLTTNLKGNEMVI